MSASKPCSLCGATPHHGLGKVEHCQLHGEPFQRFSVWCPKGHMKVTAMSEVSARAEWNTRPIEDAATAEAQALRGALSPFVDLRHQPEAGKVILKALDGMAPITVTVTKDQMNKAATLIYCAERAALATEAE